jgi:predicted Ser/Thr protein kinase
MGTPNKAGRYEIMGELGRGAMGVVYKAMDPVIGRTVAVKTIRLSAEGSGLSRPEMLQRFQTEARAAGLLTHPNIVVVYDAGEEDGLYYITMELVEGKSLQALLESGQRFPLSRVLRILEQTCSALQFAHERNVVHRDIKPANLMMTADDTVKVTDFGTAKILQFGSTQQTAHVMGTPSYMSPEQVKGKAVDGRSDIFSLGVMFYEMMTGEKPFPGQNITTVIYKIVNEEPQAPRQIDPSIHPGIDAVILKALTKDPNARYQSCYEMLEDLRNYRLVGGSTDSTMVLSAAPAAGANRAPRAAAPPPRASAPKALAPAQPLRLHPATSPASPAGPVQAPAVHRTAPVEPLQKPKSMLGTMLAALFLLGVIIFGGYRVRPFFEDLMQRREAQRANGTAPAAAVTPPAPMENPSAEKEVSAPAPPPASTDAVETKPVESPASSASLKRSGKPLSSGAAEFKGRMEEAIAQKGLTGRVKLDGTGNTLTLTGRLRPREHRELLKELRSAPKSVQIVDDINYDDKAEAEPGSEAAGEHPVPSAGRGAIHVVTDVLGATATLRGAAGRLVSDCQTPCSFNNLPPAPYRLEVIKDGYQPVRANLQVGPMAVIDKKFSLESLAQGIYVRSQPPGADVFVNGQKQPGKTPLNLPIAPGQYDLVVSLEGYENHSEQVQIKDNIQTQLDVTLTQRSYHPAWVNVETSPPGAEILIDGKPTGKFAPARVEMTAGDHWVSFTLNGYRPIRKFVGVQEGQTVDVNAELERKIR